MLVVLNFTPVVRKDYRIGVPEAGVYQEILNSDSVFYGGSNISNGVEILSQQEPTMGQPHSVELTLPPLGALVLQKKG